MRISSALFLVLLHCTLSLVAQCIVICPGCGGWAGGHYLFVGLLPR